MDRFRISIAKEGEDREFTLHYTPPADADAAHLAFGLNSAAKVAVDLFLRDHRTTLAVYHETLEGVPQPWIRSNSC